MKENNILSFALLAYIFFFLNNSPEKERLKSQKGTWTYSIGIHHRVKGPALDEVMGRGPKARKDGLTNSKF